MAQFKCVNMSVFAQHMHRLDVHGVYAVCRRVTWHACFDPTPTPTLTPSFVKLNLLCLSVFYESAKHTGAVFTSRSISSESITSAKLLAGRFSP